jgi:predicted nucleotidyltransferase
VRGRKHDLSCLPFASGHALVATVHSATLRCVTTGDDVLDTLRRHFAAHTDGIVAVYLYGSVARGTARADSDVDVAILFAHAPPATLQGLPTEHEDRLTKATRRPVQIVVLNEAPPDLVHRILRDSILVCEHDRAARVRFEVRARNEYFDLLPILRRYRRRA